ncbi:hypothetical protein, partial [Mycobacteroides abscessus]
RALSCPPVGSSYWPRVGIFMSAYGQFFMSVDTLCIKCGIDSVLAENSGDPITAFLTRMHARWFATTHRFDGSQS